MSIMYNLLNFKSLNLLHKVGILQSDLSSSHSQADTVSGVKPLPVRPGISYGCWFKSQLLHFQPNSLLMRWENSGEWRQGLGPPHSCGRPIGSCFGFSLLQPWPLWPFQGVKQWMEDVSVSPSPSPILCHLNK